MRNESKELGPGGTVDPGGPVVVACLGHRCAGLHALTARDSTVGPLPGLKHSVRSSRTGMLITTGCMGPCSHGAVVGVGHRVPTKPGDPLVVLGVQLLGGMERPIRAEALTAWFEEGGPGCVPLPMPVLTEASLGN